MKALMSVTSGDTAYFLDGTYAPSAIRNEGTLFEQMVTFKAYENNKPTLLKFTAFWNINGTPLKKTINLTLDGFHFSEGIWFQTVQNIVIKNSTVEIPPPWIGSIEAIEKVAVYLRNTNAITLDNLDITRTAKAITLFHTTNTIVRSSIIHDITHDGIRIVGTKNTLIENNIIRGLNDGVNDTDANWSRHCDAIHIFVSGANAVEQLIPNDGVLIRGNILKDVEAQSVQFNNYGNYPGSDHWNRNILFEHNVFAPSVSPNTFNNADPVVGLIFRHNTFVQYNASYTSPYPELQTPSLTLSGINFRASSQAKHLQVYNNIFYTTPYIPGDYDIYGYNIIQNVTPGTRLPRTNFQAEQNTIFSTPYQLSNDGSYGLIPNSSIINAGFRYDAGGSLSDATPNIGAYPLSQVPLNIEISQIRQYIENLISSGIPVIDALYQNTQPSTLQIPDNAILVDDFEDGNIHYDPFYNDIQEIGLQWRIVEDIENVQASFGFEFVSPFDNALRAPLFNDAQINTILAVTEIFWQAFEFSFDNFAAYQVSGGGPVFLWQDPGNYYYLDIGVTQGKFWRVENGVHHLLLEDSNLAATHNLPKRYSITIKQSPDGVKFEFTIDNSVDLEVFDTEISDILQATRGYVGFMHDTTQEFHRLLYDNVRIQQLLGRPLPPTILNVEQHHKNPPK